MFKKGEMIVYGRNGICEVTDVTTLELDGIPKDKLYYILRPYKEKDGRIFGPVENPKTVMRRVITEEEARNLIELIPQLELLEISNDRQREMIYKECMRSCQCTEWIKMIKTLYIRGMRRAQRGKKVTTTDEKYLKMAESCLYSELSLVLGMTEKGMRDDIRVRVKDLQ